MYVAVLPEHLAQRADRNAYFTDASSGDTTRCLLGIFGVDQRDADGNSVAIIGGLFLKVRSLLPSRRASS